MLSQGVRILVATKPVDFRKGHDGLAALVQSTLAEDPFTGTVFVFRAKRADRMKILFWDGSGLVMAYNHLHSYYTSFLVSTRFLPRGLVLDACDDVGIVDGVL
ncbi:IS66 family insertion sequence element accessory protein TnpB [Leisingera sp. ANG59]|uniref:IS66 family insertion sequence element accessory protein TnpB n=1 Tax=Leisingera sp. ANG59 TaxID=2675221 RepID=UPI00349FE32A